MPNTLHRLSYVMVLLISSFVDEKIEAKRSQATFPESCLSFFSLWLQIFLKFFFLFYFIFYTLHNCISFAKYQNESATGIHVFPILKSFS